MKSKPLKKANHFPVKLMGCGFVITAIHEDAQIAWDAIRAGVKEMNRIEDLISSWKSTSQTTKINNQAGIEPVKVDRELFNLIERSLKISNLTFGAFDISGSLSRDFWNFNNQENQLLPLQKIQELMGLIDFNNIQLNEDRSTVFLRKKGMKIGFGGIGKGYAAERAKSVMLNMGIEDGLVNASGDLIFWGNPPNKHNWDVNIPDPRDREFNLLSIGLDQGAIVTSGSYENYTLIDGKRYSHIINPRSGMPVTHTKNVTIVCPNAELGDGLATAFSVLPIEESLNLCNQLAGIETIIIDQYDNIHYSSSLKLKAYA
jgi:thiamine biosynthesis lipoprotein